MRENGFSEIRFYFLEVEMDTGFWHVKRIHLGWGFTLNSPRSCKPDQSVVLWVEVGIDHASHIHSELSSAQEASLEKLNSFPWKKMGLDLLPWLSCASYISQLELQKQCRIQVHANKYPSFYKSHKTHFPHVPGPVGHTIPIIYVIIQENWDLPL